jgi:ribosomal protein S18 acetylase RimI-like enzyme
VVVRRLTSGEADAYRRVRLAALSDASSAFGSTYEEEAQLTSSQWQGRLDNEARAVLVAEEDTEIVGLAVGAPDDEDPGAGFLLSMWVAPSARGHGHGDDLVQAVLAWSSVVGLRLVRLHVTEGNGPAVELYRRNGFGFSGQHFVRDRDGAREWEMVHSSFG